MVTTKRDQLTSMGSSTWMGSGAARADDRERPAQRLDPVRSRSGPSRAADRPADAVVGISGAATRPGARRHLDVRRAGVLGGVGERLGDDVVRRHLDRRRETRVRSTSSSTGTAERRASVRRAGPSPPSERIAGWMPREISRSSSITPPSSVVALPISSRSSGESAGTVDCATAVPARARRAAAGPRRAGRARCAGGSRRRPRRSAPATRPARHAPPRSRSRWRRAR